MDYVWIMFDDGYVWIVIYVWIMLDYVWIVIYVDYICEFVIYVDYMCICMHNGIYL